MDNRKFEQLIDLIINENEEQAKALFHDIVVEKSREIYESMMDEELEEGYTVSVQETNDDMEESDQVGDMMDEVEGDMTGQAMSEEDDEFADIDMDDEEGDMDHEEFGGDDDMDMGGEEDLEDRVVDLEDKLDELMAEFEELMGHEEGEEDMGDEESDEDSSDDEMMETRGPGNMQDYDGPTSDDDEDDEDSLEESVQLKKVPGLYGSNIGGDNGVNTKSIALTKPKVVSTGAKTIALGSQEAGKGGTQGGLLKPTSKTIPGTYKNAPGGKNFSEKGEAAPKPQHGKGGEGQNNKSIVGESKKSVKKIIKKR